MTERLEEIKDKISLIKNSSELQPHEFLIDVLEEARTWYKEITGFDDDELYDPEEVEIVSPSYKVRKSEEDSELISVKEIVEEDWKGKPFIVTTMGC